MVLIYQNQNVILIQKQLSICRWSYFISSLEERYNRENVSPNGNFSSCAKNCCKT